MNVVSLWACMAPKLSRARFQLFRSEDALERSSRNRKRAATATLWPRRLRLTATGRADSLGGMSKLSSRPTSRTRLCAILLCGAATGCVLGGLGDDEAGEEIEDICNDESCELKLKCVGLVDLLSGDGTPFAAFCGDAFNGSSFQEAIELHCEGLNSGLGDQYPIVDAQFVECPGSLADPDGCITWAPATHVRLDVESGIYVADLDFVESTIGFPAALWDCDTARIRPLDSGSGYELTEVARDDLFYAMGLRNGDIFVELNGSPLVNYSDIVVTLTRLHLLGEDEFELVVQRRGNDVAFQYEVTP